MDVVKKASFEAIIQSSITACDGRPLCLEEVVVDGEPFIGLGTKCDTRFKWTNELYVTLTNEEHYDTAQNGTVPEETQRWVIASRSGCLKQLHDFDGPEYAAGDRLGVDPACNTGFDSEFFAIASPVWENRSLHELDQPFSLTESHPGRTRRLAYYANTTIPYTDESGENCTCVDFDNDPLGALMVTQAHYHLYTPKTPERAYFHERSACDGASI